MWLPKVVWIKIFPDKPVTAKPAETRMGSGKGSLEYWVAVVKPGRVMFEIAGVPEETAREALRLAMHKLPCKCKIASRADLEGGGSRSYTRSDISKITEAISALTSEMKKLRALLAGGSSSIWTPVLVVYDM